MFNRYACLFMLLLGTITCLNSSGLISYNVAGTRPSPGWNADSALWVINNQAQSINPFTHFISTAHSSNQMHNPTWNTLFSALTRETKAGTGVLGKQAEIRASRAEL